MNASPPRVPSVLTLLVLLLLCHKVSAQELHDSGYEDGSLVDQTGQYYYPQHDGSFADAYGSTYSPIGEGLYTDPLGNLIDVGPNAAPMDAPPLDAAAEPDLAPARPPIDGDRGPLGPKEWPRAGKPRASAKASHGNADFGSMYLDEVGDGYLAIDPDEIAADPRLADPSGADVDGVSRANQGKASARRYALPGERGAAARGGAPTSPDADINSNLDDRPPPRRNEPQRRPSMDPLRNAPR